ncbi:MAG TPA: phenylalanine--tRNA ligase subunit alpha [Kiritimatiellia bacterium]|nr:phenylalanine--tRNA ligase subunit alpha [Kiritimatiellia bacterium]
MNIGEITALTESSVAEATSAETASALEAVRIKYLGRNGLINEIMAALKTAVPEQRRDFGQAANQFKVRLQTAIDEKRLALEAQPEAPSAALDFTLPGAWPPLGRKHPITKIIDRSIEIFRGMGFIVAEGPDIEDEFHNFDALNTPKIHPSRDPQDTFYLKTGQLLRTHTSPVQIRYMETHQPPIRIIAPGRAYRRDTTDATHSASFHQIEGLYVDREVSLANLKADVGYYLSNLMEREVQIRMRPHFFPFTEPSVELDFSCHVCGGKGCRVCKNSGWIEIAGAGMVDPNVFKAAGYDPESVSGYAFGMGVERLAMIMYGVPDIRMLYENDARFLAQF